MKIKSNASPSETASEFYKLNENFCADFESYIASKNGKVKGNYNAWSYIVFGKISSPQNWDLMYKKSIFTSTSLLLSSKYQSLLVMAEWATKIKGLRQAEFTIRRKTKLDFLKKMINGRLVELDHFDKYVLETKEGKSKLVAKLTEILKSLFLSGEIYMIDYRDDKLVIEMRTEEHHFEILDELITEIST